MAKIVLFADGTGNARTGQFRTNVWKLYSALDGRPETDQVAYYHDGVGTSAFAPLRLLGGIFGYGLGRNVQALYGFVCRNYTGANDELHLFGFSRGAFTVRVLAGLIASEGVRHITDDATLAAWVHEAYAANRRRISLAQVGAIRRLLIEAAARLRRLAAAPFATKQDLAPLMRPDIAFLGVWDTVAAYGGPIIEMVRGFDRWIWPLSMPDYRLSPKVLCARHALSLDEEREAFLPLPWDELGSEHPERIAQVWFAGVHSDVGGGYPDEGLSSIPLLWMLDEAKAAGLAFLPDDERSIREVANAWAPMHDSRSGVATAYRYQPRSINALMGLTPNSPLRDPASGNEPLLSRVVVHASAALRAGLAKAPAATRSAAIPDGYAPIVLPTTFELTDGRHCTLPPENRDQIWHHVSARRWMQRLLLLTILFMLLAPLYPKPAMFQFVDQGLAGPLGLALALVPFVPPWLKAVYASAACWLIVFALLLCLWLRLGDRERTAIRRLSSVMWNGVHALPATRAGAAPPPAASRSTRSLDFGRALQRSLRWQILPAVFGLGYYLAGALIALIAIVQLSLAVRETRGDLCGGRPASGAVFATKEPCHRLGGPPLRKGLHYRVKITTRERWFDRSVATGPAGFSYVQGFSRHTGEDARDNLTALQGLGAHFFGIALRREVTARWFTPVLALRSPNSRWLYKIVLRPQLCDESSCYTHVVAPVDGEAWIYVNDAVLPWDISYFYGDNLGTAAVQITPEF